MSNKGVEFDTISVLRAVASRWRLLLAVGLLAMLMLIVSVWRQPTRYSAQALLMPAMNTQGAREMFVPDIQSNVFLFGSKREVEQVLEIMHSRALVEQVNQHFNLSKVWGIDLGQPSGYEQLLAAFRSRVSITPTSYQGIQITAIDTSASMAYWLADAVAACADSLLRSIRQQSARQALVAMERHYAMEQQRLNALSDSVALANSARKAERAMRYSHELQAAAQNMVHLNNQLGMLRVEAEQSIPWLYMVDRAWMPDEPMPKRGVIYVTVWTMASVLAAACVIGLGEWLLVALRTKSE